MGKRDVIEARKGQIAEALANGVDGAMRRSLEAEYDRLDAVVIGDGSQAVSAKPIITSIASPVTQHYLPPSDLFPKDEKPDRTLGLMEEQRKASERLTIRSERTIDLQAWSEACAREIAELETTMTDEQDWFIDLWRRDLGLAERELQRRERLEMPKLPYSGQDDQVDWQSLIDKVKERVNLVSLFEGYGVDMRKSGKLYKGCCPWHDDKEPSLVIRPGPPGYYRCYGCGTHGNVIGFIMSTRNLRFLEAVHWLAEDYFISV